MAIHLLEGKKVPHIPLYDLQSFFFVFVWVCITFEGPQMPLPKLPSVLRYWVDHPMEVVATYKRGQLLTDTVFKEQLISQFTPFFGDLCDLARNFRNALHFETDFNPSEWQTNLDPHDKVIELFNDELQHREQIEELRKAQEQVQAQASAQAQAPDNASTPQTNPRRLPRIAAMEAALANVQLNPGRNP
jgi:hypothetical protein